MTYPLINRKFQNVTPPRANNATGIGQVVAIPVGSAAGFINMSVLTPATQTYNSQAAQTSQQSGPVGNYITIFADGCDIGIIVGLTANYVSGGAAPVLSAQGKVDSSGTYTAATGSCYRIPNGKSERFHFQKTEDLYLGYVGGTSGVTGTMRMYQSNAPVY